MYIMFPIGWMYYFGTNLEDRFSVPDFWPKAENSNRVPFEKDEIRDEIQRIKERQIQMQLQKLQGDKAQRTGGTVSGPDG